MKENNKTRKKHQTEKIAPNKKAAAHEPLDPAPSHRSLAQNLPGIVYRLLPSEDNRMVFFNEMVEELTGYSAQELQQGSVCSFDSLILQEDRPRVLRTVKKALSAIEPFEVEYRLRHKDGTVRHFMEKGMVQGPSNGQRAFVDGFILDVTRSKTAEQLMITTIEEMEQRVQERTSELKKATQRMSREALERKATENTLRVSNELLERIFSATDFLLAYLDSDFNFIRVNEAYANSGRRPHEDFVGRNHFDLYPDEENRRIFKRVVRTGKPFSAQSKPFRHPDQPERGTTYWDWTLYPVKNARSKVQGLVLSLYNVTEKERSKQAMRDSEEKYRQLFELSPLGIAVHDLYGRYLYVNPSYKHMFGRSGKELIGKNYIDVKIPPEDREREKALLRSLLKNEPKIEPFDNVNVHGDGQRITVRYYADFTRDNDGNVDGFIVYGEEVTELRRLEEERTRAQRLEGLGVLAGGIAHDFNNLLTSVFGNISLARLFSRKDGRADIKLQEAERALTRTKDLTQQLLTFAKGGSPVVRDVRLGGLIEDSASFALSGSNLKCKVSLPKGLWRVRADEGQISQAIQNLVANARDSMPDGGTIRISAANETVSAGQHDQLQKGCYVAISIVDRGTGIQAEHLLKVFDPYFTTKKKGSGLGLATTYSIIDKHKGLLTVQSETGKGSTFTFWLPAIEGTATEEAPAPARIIGGRGRVLIMDDEDIVRDTAAEMLKNLGYEVELSTDGEEAVMLYTRSMSKGEKPFDAVIMDLTIPGGMGGKEALGLLRMEDPDVRAIVSSGYSDDEVMSDFKAHGFSAALAKPYSVDELGEVLGEVLSEVLGNG